MDINFLKKIFNKNWPLFLGTFIYFFLFWHLKYFSNFSQVPWYSDDSITYINFFNSLLPSGSVRENIEVFATRTYGYPLFLGVTTSVSIYFFLFCQYLLWLGSLLIALNIIEKINSKKIVKILSFIILATLIDPILLSAHALTETLSCFLLLLIVKFLFEERNKWLSLPFLGFLVTVRPSFIYFYFIIFFLFSLFYFKEIKSNLLNLIFFLIFPAIQVVIMLSLFSTPTLSFISSGAFNDYFMAKLDKEEYGGNTKDYLKKRYLEISRPAYLNPKITKDYAKKVKKELFERFNRNPSLFLKTYFNIIKKNGSRNSNYVEIFKKSPFWRELTGIQNKLIFSLALISIFMSILVFLFSVKRFFTQPDLAFLALSAHTILSLLASGFSFYQGSRFTVPIMFSTLILFNISLAKLRFLFLKVK